MSGSVSIYFLMLVSGFLGGFGHCVGMCFPIVAACAFQPVRPLAPHLLYNLGRIITYALIGGVMGAAGSFVAVIRPMENFQHWATAAMGLLMLVMGGAAGGWFSVGETAGWNMPAGAVRRLVGSGTLAAFFPLGLLLGFIPCGLSYTAFIAAAGEGAQASSPAEGFLRGMLMLLLFGVGTMPALLLVGGVATLAGRRVRLALYRCSSLAMMAAGALLVYRGLAK